MGSGGVVLGLLLELNELLQGGRDGAEEVDVVERMSEVMPPVLENYCRPGRARARELRSVCQLVDLALARFPAVFRHGQGPELSALWVHLVPHLVEPHLGGETRSRLVHTLRLAGDLYAQGSPSGFHHALVVGFRNLLADLVLATALLPRAGTSPAAGPPGTPRGGEGEQAPEVVEVAVLPELLALCRSDRMDMPADLVLALLDWGQWEALCLAGMELLEGLVPSATGAALGAVSVLESLDFFIRCGVRGVLPPASRLAVAIIRTSCDCLVAPIDSLLHSVLDQINVLAGHEQLHVAEDLEAAACFVRVLHPHSSYNSPFQIVSAASGALRAAMLTVHGRKLVQALDETLRSAVRSCPSVSPAVVTSLVDLLLSMRAESTPCAVLSILYAALSECFRHGFPVGLVDMFSGVPLALRGEPMPLLGQVLNICESMPQVLKNGSRPIKGTMLDVLTAVFLGWSCQPEPPTLSVWKAARDTLNAAAGLESRHPDAAFVKRKSLGVLHAVLLIPRETPENSFDKKILLKLLKFPWLNNVVGADTEEDSIFKCYSLACAAELSLHYKDDDLFRKLFSLVSHQAEVEEEVRAALAAFFPFLNDAIFSDELQEEVAAFLQPALSMRTDTLSREGFLIGFQASFSARGSALCHMTSALQQLLKKRWPSAEVPSRALPMACSISNAELENASSIPGASDRPDQPRGASNPKRPAILGCLRDVIKSTPLCEASLSFSNVLFQCVKLVLRTSGARQEPWIEEFVGLAERAIQLPGQDSVLGRLQRHDSNDLRESGDVSAKGLAALQIVASFELEDLKLGKPEGRSSDRDPDSFLSQLQRVVFDDALSISAQIFTLKAVTLFGAHAVDQGSLIVAIIILVGSLDRGWSQRSVAAWGLGVIMEEHGFQTQDLASQLPMVFEYLGRNLIQRPTLIEEAADVLFHSNREALLRHALTETLPRIVDACDASLLEAFSKALGVKSGQLLLDNGHIALCPALNCSTQAELNKILKYVEEVTGDSWEEILRAKARLLVELVIWNEAELGFQTSSTLQCISVPDAKVESARRQVEVVRCALETNDRKQSGETTIEADVPNFLYSRYMLGLLASINAKLRETAQMDKTPGADAKRRSRPLLVRTQVQSLRMVEILVKLAESRVGPFTPDVMALLNHGLQKPDPQVQRQALVCLHALVFSLSKFVKGQLATLLHQIVVMVLPFAEMAQTNGQGGLEFIFEVEVKQILSELLINNRRLLGKEFQHLPPLPDLPFLKSINAALAAAKSALDKEGELRNLILNLEHDSQAVRYVALDRLRIFLSREKAWVDKMFAPGVSPGGRIEQLKVSLLESLLKCCEVGVRTALTGKMSLRCADCLGQLGAIDPAFLPNVLQGPTARLVFDLDDDLPLKLISTELLRLLTTASDLGTLESTRYAIQQLLKQYMNSSVEDLAEDVRVYVRPLLTSRYRLEKNVSKESSVSPIFGSAPMSFREWLLLWTKELVSQVPAEHEWKALFDSCQGLFKYDMRTMLSVLPYLVGTVLAHGTKAACDAVRMEILSVLNGSSKVEGQDGVTGPYGESMSRATPAPSLRVESFRPKASVDREREAEESGSMAELSMQAVFDLLDKLGNYVSLVKKRESFEGKKARCARKVEGTLNKIPKSLLAHAALKCGAHARALQHYELHLRITNKHGLNPAARSSIEPLPDDYVTSLLEMYVPLEEPDGLAGIVKLRKSQSLSIDDKLLGEMAGNWTDVLSMYEKDLQEDMANRPHELSASPGHLSSDQRGYMRCLLNTGHLKALQTHVDGLLAKETSVKIRAQIAAFGADAAWRLGQWGPLETYVEQNAMHGAHLTEAGWPTRLGRLLLSAKACDSEGFNDGMGKARTALMAPLAAASMESYGRAYPFLVRLHMLHELETAYTAFLNFRSSLTSANTANAIKTFIANVGGLNWRERISRTQPMLAVREPLIVFHRTLCILLKDLCEEEIPLSARDMGRVTRLLRSSVGESWLDQAQMCRRAGHAEPASVAVLQAVGCRTPTALLEKARLLWQNDKKHQAISELRMVEANTQLLNSNKRGEAKALLRLARWAGLTGHARDDQLVALYRDVIKRDKDWDKGYFHFAEYLDKVMQDTKQRSNEAEMSSVKGLSHARRHGRHHLEYLPEVIRQYGSSASRGTKKLFENLPRMLTLWFNFGADEKSFLRDKNCRDVAARVSRDVSAIMTDFAKTLPTSAWLAVLPQLISRVCHPNADVAKVTKSIITRVLLRFPQQVLWSLAAVSKSNVVARRNTALEIIASARRQATEKEVRELFQEFDTFVEQMKKLCNHAVDKSTKSFMLSKSAQFNLLKRTLPVRLIVPIQAALTPSFPAGAAGLRESPFGAEHTTSIQEVQDRVVVLSSLQKPKKVELVGANGRTYTFLFKPKDDLRKDARLMEFANVLNQLFAKAPQSRRRGLYLRTFAVVPLTEDCGMIEWVPNTHMLRGCCTDTYAEVGLWETNSQKLREVQQIHKELYDTVDARGRDPTQWLDKILDMYPPMLHRWFIRTFPEPSQWFKARLNYSRTAAVWSMVGHILGLGDRHGENVLLDGISGDVVHVDFACLFDKGLELAQPEVVPFRLTQNMIDACGIQGCEGVFRRTCEISLSVLRSNRGALMSVLDTFVHDPLVEWTDSHTRAGSRAAPREQDNPFAVQALENIQSRLSGVVVGVDAAPSLPLSPEGQADRLIAEAASKRNLGDMYIWWMPWF